MRHKKLSLVVCTSIPWAQGASLSYNETLSKGRGGQTVDENSTWRRDLPLLKPYLNQWLWNLLLCSRAWFSYTHPAVVTLEGWEQGAYIEECLSLQLMPTVSAQRDHPLFLFLLDMFPTVRQTLMSPIPFLISIASLTSLCWAQYQRILLMGNAEPMTSGILTRMATSRVYWVAGGKKRILCGAHSLPLAPTNYFK